MIIIQNMGTKVLLIIISYFFTISTAEMQQKDVINTISGYFKTSDSHDLSGYFSPLIEMNILSEENEYSKAQAELILRDFFSKHKPASVKILHRINSSSNFRFGVLSFQTDKDKFRVSISMTNEGEKFLIKTIRIEYDKE